MLLVLTLVGIAAAVGSLLLGEHGLWLALATCALTLLIEPVVASAMTLRLYGVRPLRSNEAPVIWSLLRALTTRAGLPNTPVPYYVPSDIVNAFATGSRRLASIALTDGLLRSLSMRELQAVLGDYLLYASKFWVLWPSSRHLSPKIRVFVDHLCTHLHFSAPPPVP